MNAPRVHILVLLLTVCGLRALPAQELSPSAVPAPESDPVDTQLRLNMTALLENSSDKNRIDAATLLLFNENAAAREFLLGVLKRTDNPRARAAVCEALNPARTWHRPLKNKEDFIKPLIGIITSEQDFTIAKLAAEATLIFGYSQVQQDLERAASDASLPVNARLNVIYALRRHPDKQAVAKLITMLDSTEPQVVDAVRAALAAVGISVSQDAGARKQMLTELQQRGTEAFMRERLIRQESRMREMDAELQVWQKRYQTALNTLYESLSDEAAKNAFLAQNLGAQELSIRLWALDKLEELRRGTSKPKVSEQLQAVLLGLISDPSRQVRSKTARLLAGMGELNAAKPLLEQLKSEPDELVRREIFMALGAACYFASLPTAGHKVPEEIRRETLKMAAEFLDQPDADRARSGAEVIGKLLEQDGLDPNEVDKYLKALADRYVRAGAGTDQGLRGYLLGTMAGLCAARNSYRTQAAKLYSPMFERALGDSTDILRQAAVDGLVNVDKPSALRRLRKDMVNDGSPVIRARLIDLAGEVGAAEDLAWLAERLGIPAEGEAAWRAMLKVFGRSATAVLVDWMARLDAPPLAGKVPLQQKMSFLTLVEQRGQSENNATLLKSVQESLAQLYIADNNSKQASEYLKLLLAGATNDKDKQRLRSQLVAVYLRSANVDLAVELVSNSLADKSLDMGPEGPVVRSIEEYLNSPACADPNALLKSLEQVKVKDSEAAQGWRALVNRWSERFAKAKKTDESERVSN